MEAPLESQADPAAVAAVETRGSRARRHGRRARLYAWTVVGIATLVVLVTLAAANARSVKVNWIVGSAHASLVWVVMATAVLAWLLGVATSIVFRFRTRRP